MAGYRLVNNNYRTAGPKSQYFFNASKREMAEEAEVAQR